MMDGNVVPVAFEILGHESPMASRRSRFTAKENNGTIEECSRQAFEHTPFVHQS